MGDRTTVTVTVLKEDFELAKSFFEQHNEPFADIYDLENNLYVQFHFEEVNYGDLDCLEKLTDEAPFAFDYDWESGCEYSAGTKTVRFTSTGERVHTCHYQDDQQCSLEQLEHLRASNPDPVALAAALDDLIKKIKEEWVPLPWANQHEYAKLWRVQHLLE